MSWEIEYTDQFEEWWNSLNEGEQDSVAVVIELLGIEGVHLDFPYSSSINGSKHSHMRELRKQHAGEPYRVLYAFDPRRHAILLLGGNKGGDDRWYEENVPLADRLYDEHLQELQNDGEI